MAQGITRLIEAGLHPPFAFMYDEFWLLFVKLDNIFKRLLGPDYRILPDFWAWCVDPKKGEAGWTPHRDKGRIALFEDGKPKSLTVWIPLTEATTLNGCMYLVPADRDPVYGTEREKLWPENMNYAGIRALPAQPGSVFFWNQAILHWGSQTSPRAPGPRISIAFEFQRGDVDPFNKPLMNPMHVPGFEDRLKLIGKQVLQYKHMYPLSPELEALARSFLPPQP
jgi:ectoine hydroxylase-related dioxygenase (phytanoyl-CoA dioxygenase family)